VTKDVTVTVIGTVFLVNAEEAGSRVAVIEGEVRVQHGAAEEKLRRGEQVVTNPKMESVPVTKEIEWSRNAETLLARLQPPGAQVGVTRPADTPKWEAVSIRPCAPAGAGGARGGGGGGGTGNSPVNQADPQFMVIRCKNVWGLVLAAYENVNNGVPDANHGNPGAMTGEYSFHTNPIVGAPDWTWKEQYTIEAKAEKPVGPAMMRGPMLQTILEDRFKLKLGRENRDINMHVLTVAKGGAKLKPHQEGSCAPVNLTPQGLAPLALEELKAFMAGRPACGFVKLGFGGPPAVLPPPERHKTEEAMGLTVEEFIQGLMLHFVQTTETPIVDKTGIKGKYDFKLEYAFTPEEIKRRIQGGRGPSDPRDVGRPESDFDTGPTLEKALEDQLGLKLDKTKGPWPHLVIEHIERPSPN
jgi:uncharacterized protein (TIGR03435 family)